MQTSTSFDSWVPKHGSSMEETWRDAAIDALSGAELEDVGLGLRFRAAVPGPEHDFVEAFLEALSVNTPNGRRLTVFCQPGLDSGYPDLVAVVWKTATARSWAPEREQLQCADLRLLHAIVNKGWMDINFLESVYRRNLSRTLDRLQEFQLVTRTARKCRVRSLKDIFTVEQIIAIEAKVTWCRRAVEQAGANVWFSSESHVLVPSVNNSEAMLETARQFQVGVIEFDQSNPSEFCSAPRREVPLSYGSWLFNEWVWRIARRRGDL